MTLQQLKYLISLGQYLHFGTAARACFVSQPSLSLSIAELEKEIGIQLIDRSNRSVQMTPAGKDFLSSATEIIQMADNAVLQAKRVDCGTDGHISGGILCGLYTDTFPAAVKRFKDKYPCLDVELQPVNMNTMKTRLSQGMLDIALTRRLSGEEFNGNLDFRVLFKDRFKLALHRDHPLADRGSIELAELKDDPFVFLSETASTSTYRYTLELCARRGFTPRIDYKSPTLESLCTMLRAGMGCAIVPECREAYGSDDLVFLQIDGEDTVSDVVLVWKRQNANTLIPLFLEELQGCFSP
jgi:DNA-binding transcriptional LysR family regulator